MTTRITFNMTSDETLRIVDEYCHTHKLSRSKVIDALLSATAPVLNDINCYYQLAGKLQSRLLNGVYQRDLPHKRNVVSAEKYCLRSGKTNFSPKESWSLTVQMVFCTRWNIKDTIAGIRWLDGLKAGVSKTFANTRCNCPGRRQNMPVLFILKEQYTITIIHPVGHL